MKMTSEQLKGMKHYLLSSLPDTAFFLYTFHSPIPRPVLYTPRLPLSYKTPGRNCL